MNVTFIKESEAPKPPAPMSKAATEVLGILDQIKPGQVAKVEPDDGQTIRGLKVSFGRVAKARNIKIQSWSLPGENVMYVKRLDK